MAFGLLNTFGCSLFHEQSTWASPPTCTSWPTRYVQELTDDICTVRGLRLTDQCRAGVGIEINQTRDTSLSESLHLLLNGSAA